MAKQKGGSKKSKTHTKTQRKTKARPRPSESSPNSTSTKSRPSHASLRSKGRNLLDSVRSSQQTKNNAFLAGQLQMELESSPVEDIVRRYSPKELMNRLRIMRMVVYFKHGLLKQLHHDRKMRRHARAGLTAGVLGDPELLSQLVDPAAVLNKRGGILDMHEKGLQMIGQRAKEEGDLLRAKMNMEKQQLQQNKHEFLAQLQSRQMNHHMKTLRLAQEERSKASMGSGSGSGGSSWLSRLFGIGGGGGSSSSYGTDELTQLQKELSDIKKKFDEMDNSTAKRVQQSTEPVINSVKQVYSNQKSLRNDVTRALRDIRIPSDIVSANDIHRALSQRDSSTRRNLSGLQQNFQRKLHEQGRQFEKALLYLDQQTKTKLRNLMSPRMNNNRNDD